MRRPAQCSTRVSATCRPSSSTPTCTACWLNTAAALRHGEGDAADGERRPARGRLLRDLVRELDDVADEVLDGWVADAADARRRAGRRGRRPTRHGVEPRRLGAARRRRLRRAARRVRHLHRSTSTGRSPRACAPATSCRGTDRTRDGRRAQGHHRRVARHAHRLVLRPLPGLGPDDHPYGLATVAYDDLVPLMRRAHEAGLASAIHAIGDGANARRARRVRGGRLPGHDRARAAGRVTPTSRASRRSASWRACSPSTRWTTATSPTAYWAGRTDRAFMLADLAADGRANSLFGSDAPVAPLDPWVAIAAAVFRTRDGREPWHPEQAIEARRRSPPRPAVTARRCGSALRRTSPSSSSIRSRHPSTTCAGCRWRRPSSPDASRTARR